jgi:soluble lytic murein transglycosylase-like protein
MLNLGEARGEILELPSKQSNARRPAERPRPNPRPRSMPGSHTNPWQSAALFSLCVLFVLAAGFAFYSYQRASALEVTLQQTLGEMQAGMQELKAGVDFDTSRQQALLRARDEILKVNENISLGEAYRYAELLMAATDKYPSVDPALLLSIGIVESGFDPKARSHADARGLYQIWPSTGRMLAAMLGWEYSDEMLYDSHRNTEMAALYLDVLLTTYNDVGLALAEYNGGPINAGLYRARSHKTAAETRDYVPKVLEQYERLVKVLPNSAGGSFDIIYRDGGRSGKRLGEATTAD